MPSIDCIVETAVSNSTRAKQICGMFDVPVHEKSKLQWKINAPIEEKEWSVGLIVGPSGSGKSTIAKHLYGDLVDAPLKWKGASIIDDFAEHLTLEEITGACSSVGFNTIPAWLRPFDVLSNGEKFRCEMARRLIETDDLIVVDEFTSVVDRQVAKIGSHAVQKYVRRNQKQFVAVTCHYDVIDWLQPDWIIDASKQSFQWRSLRQRPTINVEIKRVKYHEWDIFSKYHYMSNDMSKAARCFGLFVNGQIVAFTGIIHRPHPIIGGWKACSRLVTLPDWQGMGLAFVLINTVGSAYRALGENIRCYPAHPSFIRSYKKQKYWKNHGQRKPQRAGKNALKNIIKSQKQSMRTPFIFEYRGPRMAKKEAKKLINGV
mgnify:CR=1 FL=1